MGALHMLSIIGKTSMVHNKPKTDNEFMNVELHINDKSDNVMIGSRTTYNFIDVLKAQRSGRVLTKDAS